MRTKITFTKYPYMALAQNMFSQVGKLPKIKVMGNRTVEFEFEGDLTEKEISIINNIVTSAFPEFRKQKVEKVK